MTTLASVLPWIQIILSVLLIGAVLLQQSEAGLGGAFGGNMDTNVFKTKRGIEKQLFITTIVIAILFAASALASLFI